MESRTHLRLKRLAVAFLREAGCRIVATEVRCPISRYRVDVAGYVDRAAVPGRPGPPRRCPPRTVLIECKRSRADFVRDRRDQAVLLERRETLDRLRRAMEEKRLMREEPDLRRSGASLFPELEEWDFAGARLPAYRDLVRRLRRLDLMIHGETKFCMAARYALADRLYIAAPRGLLRGRDLPPGWGLLEAPRSALRDDDANADLFGDSRLIVARPAPRRRPAKEVFRDRLLRNIAAAASATATAAIGVR